MGLQVMYVSSISSYYSPLVLHRADLMVPYTKRTSLVSPNRIVSSTFRNLQCVPSLSCGSISSTNLGSFTVEDIITSCGLSDRFRVLCESSENPSSVLNLLRNCGFSQTQVETIVSKYPRILFCNVQKTLEPKVDFLRSIGLSENELLDVVTTCPLLFQRSLNNHLIPLVDFLVTSMGCQRNAAAVIKKYPSILFHTSKYLMPNLSTLRNLGIPQSQISNIMATGVGGRVITCTKPGRFSKVVSTVTEMGFDPLSSAFKHAVIAMLFCTGSTWEGKLVFFKTLGFSDKEILNIFMVNPYLISRSEEVIRGKVEFYVNKFHWSPTQLSRRAAILTFNLEKRIIPRCLVLQLLLSRNRILDNVKLYTVLTYSEDDFLQRYVIKYKDETPEVLDAYQGKMKSAECDFYWEELRRLQFKIIL